MMAALLALLAAAPLWDRTFAVDQPAQVVASLEARCGGCSWDSPARPAAVLVLDVDGRYSQHLILARGAGPAPYRVLLGGLGAGTHRLRVRLDGAWTPAAVREVAVDDVRFEPTPAGAPAYRALA